MNYVILAFVFIAAALFAPRLLRADLPRRDLAAGALRFLFGIFAALAVLATSIVTVPADRVGVVKRLYGFSNLPEGRLMAANGETGYQAQVIPPGTWRISLLFNIFNIVEILPLVVVPNGFYGRIVARDGAPLESNQIMADAWPEAQFSNFLNAEYFLTHGGQKGLQLSVLKPGAYAINLALFEVRVGYQPNGRDVTKATDDVYDIHGLRQEDTPLITEITHIPAGSVGVVRSSVQEKGRDCTTIAAKADPDGLVAELVPQGCKGVWNVSLPPNDYYLNRDAYEVTVVSTRVTTLEFKGGYDRRYIDLKVDGKGDFAQSERTARFSEIGDDRAINTKVEGWEIPQELRAVVQISPEHAPIVVAAVGGQTEVDQRIVIPSIRSHVRNVFGGSITVAGDPAKGEPAKVTRPTRVLDTVEQRPALEEAILKLAREDGRRAGVDIKEIRLGESAIPPELLLARQREQLATQLKAAFIQEQAAQTQRQQTEQARATAEQQKELVKAQIAVQTAKLLQERRQAEGHGERLFLEEQAAGQTAQANVLGKDNVLKLQMFEKTLELLAAHPELVSNLTLPKFYVSGAGGLEGAAAIYGGLMSGAAQNGATDKPAAGR